MGRYCNACNSACSGSDWITATTCFILSGQDVFLHVTSCQYDSVWYWRCLVYLLCVRTRFFACHVMPVWWCAVLKMLGLPFVCMYSVHSNNSGKHKKTSCAAFDVVFCELEPGWHSPSILMTYFPWQPLLACLCTSSGVYSTMQAGGVLPNSGGEASSWPG